MATPEELRQNLEEIREEFILLDDTVSSLGSNIANSINTQINSLDSGTQRVAKSFSKDLTKAIDISNKSLDAQESIINKIQKGVDTSKDIEKEITKIEQQRAIIARKAEILKRNGVRIDEEEYQALLNNLDIQQEILGTLQDQNDETQSSTGLTGNLIESLGGVLQKLGFNEKVSKIFAQSIQDARVEGGSLKTQISNVGKNLKANIKPLDIGLALITASLKAFQQIDTRVASFRKNLGLSAGDALRLNDSLAATAITSNLIGVNVDTLTKSVNDLNSALGDTAIVFDEDLLVSATFLRERFGLSEEALANVTKEALSTGRSLESIKDEQLASLVAAEKTLQVNLNTNKALEKANSISGALRLNLEKSPGGLVKAVAQATALGLEIEQTAKMAGKLLDFESSIEAELEAELLTGKELNLEQARSLALQGKSVEAAAEIAKQVGSSAEFANMNVIAQQSLADAVGLTTEELANSLRKQESITSQADKFQERTAKGAEEAATSLSVQEKLAGAVEKLAGLLQFGAAAAAALAVGLSLALIPGAGLLAAAGGVAAGTIVYGGLNALLGDDVVSPAQGGSGYGKRTLFGPEGAIALNDRDTIVAGTDLKMGDDVVSPSVSDTVENITTNETTNTTVNAPSIDLGPLVEQMNKMNSTLNAILSKEGTVMLDSTKVGTALTVGSYKLQ
jgi:hypothetical protein